jgi:hypothetical protein
VRLLVASLAPLARGPLVSLTMTVPGGVPSTSAFEVASALVAEESGAPVGSAGLLVAEVRPAPEPGPVAGAPPAASR